MKCYGVLVAIVISNRSVPRFNVVRVYAQTVLPTVCGIRGRRRQRAVPGSPRPDRQSTRTVRRFYRLLHSPSFQTVRCILFYTNETRPYASLHYSLGSVLQTVSLVTCTAYRIDVIKTPGQYIHNTAPVLRMTSTLNRLQTKNTV